MNEHVEARAIKLAWTKVVHIVSEKVYPTHQAILLRLSREPVVTDLEPQVMQQLLRVNGSATRCGGNDEWVNARDGRLALT